ncbi:carbonic anhydrase 4-like [Cynoglossus semilaevis]|nr:carbonic anhydrase 4-like [Cynoglossus semilaevis]
MEEHVEISGGGLNGTYSTIQLHFHWGDTDHHPGSEHMIDGHRYPMEMHIVSLKKGLSLEEAKKDSEGIAVLGFFINEAEDGEISGAWNNLASHLTNKTDAEVSLHHNISINDLIGNVDLNKFYRYLGSLTTPTCDEAVIWTVFHEPISISKNLIQQFPAKSGLTNVFRPTQNLHQRQVSASFATPNPPSPHWCYDDHCDYNPSKWKLLDSSYCEGDHQSPINIDTHNIVMDEHLDAFIYKHFDDKHSIEYITNTGHAVKCVLKENVVELSGGGLGHVYTTLQFHFHWGSTSENSMGSEHMVDSKQFPMEMHIVSKRKDLTLDEALKTSNGIAVLGFFIEATDTTKSGSSSSDSGHHEETNPTSDMESWKKLTNYLAAISTTGSKADVTEEISIDDLLGSVDRAIYYRYNGSLTTPVCNEAVVWTVFKESIKIDQNLMKLFPTRAGYENVFRPSQSVNGRKVYISASAAAGPGITTLFLLLPCLYIASLNHYL